MFSTAPRAIDDKRKQGTECWTFLGRSVKNRECLPKSASDYWAGIFLDLSLDALRSSRLSRSRAGKDGWRPDHACRAFAGSGETIYAIHVLIAPLWLRRVEVSIPTRTPWEHLWLLKQCPLLALNPLWMVARLARNVIHKSIRAQLFCQSTVSSALMELVTLNGVLNRVFA